MKNSCRRIPYPARQICRGVLIPPTPMGTGPLFGSVGGGERTKSGSRQCTRGDFTQLRAAWMRKTLLLLVCVY